MVKACAIYLVVQLRCKLCKAKTQVTDIQILAFYGGDSIGNLCRMVASLSLLLNTNADAMKGQMIAGEISNDGWVLSGRTRSLRWMLML